MRLIAASCLPYASVLDEDIRAEVLGALLPMLRLYPVENQAAFEQREWQGLFAIGEELLPLLGSDTDLPLWLVCRLLERMGGEEALTRLVAVNARIAAEQSDRDALTSREMLARAYQEAGDLGQAIPVLEQLVTLSETVYGAGHPDTFAPGCGWPTPTWTAAGSAERWPATSSCSPTPSRPPPRPTCCTSGVGWPPPT